MYSDEMLDMTLREIVHENKLVYINKEGWNLGKLFCEGHRVKGLKEINIKAVTSDTHSHVMKLQLDVSVPGFDMEEIQK